MRTSPSERLAAFDKIFVEHQRRDDLEDAVRRLMRDTRNTVAENEILLTQADGRSAVLKELWVLPVVGPSGAMKTRSLRGILKSLNSEAGKGEIPVLYVKVRQTSRTPKSLQVQILEAFDDPTAKSLLRSREYSEAKVNEAIRNIAREKKTLLIVLDEAHSPLDGGRADTADVIGTTLKSIVNDAVFSIVLVGTKAMLPILKHSELKSRKKMPVSFAEFGLDDAAGLDRFFGFVRAFEDEMRAKKVIADSIKLMRDIRDEANIYDMTGGTPGTYTRILRLALEAYEDDDTKSKAFGWTYIERAFRAWNEDGAIPDPFRKGDDNDTVQRLAKLVPSKSVGASRSRSAVAGNRRAKGRAMATHSAT